ncbi:Gamma-glutamyltranspeptidase 1 [Bulinus truncatus]|nr:Gamma-glutamyltranspeptidase 1 [Bulinus truncatus]
MTGYRDVDSEKNQLLKERKYHRSTSKIWLILICVAVILLVAVILGVLVWYFHKCDDSPGYKTAAVAADTKLCSTVGKNILLKGGNAVDAAIAALICSGLGSPQSMGIGGGFFMTVYNRTTGQSTVIDARETAPGNATDDMFVTNNTSSAIGPLSIAVPGEIKGYWYAHQKYGHLSWSDLFQPSIQYAEEGFPVPIGLHKALIEGESFIKTEPSLKVVFWNEKTGSVYKEGEIIKMPELAQTLKAIAHGGAQTFYNGSVTDLIMQDLRDIGSIITREDLLSYTVKEKVPVEITLSSGMKVISPPAPSGGPVLSFMLNILDGKNKCPLRAALMYRRIRGWGI